MCITFLLFLDNIKKENKHQQIQLLQYTLGLGVLNIGQCLIILLNLPSEFDNNNSFYKNLPICCLLRFCNTLEEACVDSVVAGEMTKDLAACIHGLKNVKDGMYLNTNDYLESVKKHLDIKLKQ